MVAIRCRAKIDVNGNPRRSYVVMEGGNIVQTIDEEYYGIGALFNQYPELRGVNVPDFAVTAKEYRRLRRW